MGKCTYNSNVARTGSCKLWAPHYFYLTNWASHLTCVLSTPSPPAPKKVMDLKKPFVNYTVLGFGDTRVNKSRTK